MRGHKGWLQADMNNEIFNQKKQRVLRSNLRRSLTKGEIVLWNKLKGGQLPYKFRRQHSIAKYVADFYCPKLKLVIEVDGLSHDDVEQIKNDQTRQRYFETLGLTVQRFTSQEVFNNIIGVIDEIKRLCQELDKKN